MSTSPLAFKANREVFSTREEAQSSVDFRLLVPGFVPDGLTLRQVSRIAPPWFVASDGGVGAFVDMIYSGAGRHLAVSQGHTAPLDTRGAPTDSFGPVDINGWKATWVDGFLTVDQPLAETHPKDNPTAKWQKGRVFLGWELDDRLSVRLAGQGLSVDDLIKVAQSLA
ncbi:MAG TPA: hypothetical protein VFB90_03515 [Dehalococcoidia bacterium]|nr:hypothetical protein [Dehalococcoidia bacterium]